MADLNQLADQLVGLTVKEVKELADILESVHGIKPAAVAVAGGGGGGAAGGGDEVVEKTEFDVILKSAGAGKLKVVKEVKTLLGVGLRDAKALVDGAPCPVKEGAPKEEAEALKAALEAVGAEVELK